MEKLCDLTQTLPEMAALNLLGLVRLWLKASLGPACLPKNDGQRPPGRAKNRCTR